MNTPSSQATGKPYVRTIARVILAGPLVGTIAMYFVLFQGVLSPTIMLWPSSALTLIIVEELRVDLPILVTLIVGSSVVALNIWALIKPKLWLAVLLLINFLVGFSYTLIVA